MLWNGTICTVRVNEYFLKFCGVYYDVLYNKNKYRKAWYGRHLSPGFCSAPITLTNDSMFLQGSSFSSSQ